MKRSFTLVELMVVVAVIGILATMIVPSVQGLTLRARDAKRLSDMTSIQVALELYFEKYGSYPNSDYQGCGGWDASGDGDLIQELKSEGYLSRNMKDPRTDFESNCGNYCYYRYLEGSYGCDAAKGQYYVLGVRDMETSGNPHPDSAGWSCPNRDWQGEFDWVIGKFEKIF